MKTTVCAAILALLLISMAAPWSIKAVADGPSALGSYRFEMEDGATKQIDFEARSADGTATGQLTFRDEAQVVDRDPDDNETRPDDPPVEFTLTADLDTLTVDRNRALMAGTVRDSSLRSYVGRWVLLVVEDNGNEPDKFSWRVCQPEPGGWTPSDAEDPKDDGASLRWWATDLEASDDRGVESPNVMPGTARGCPTLPLASYRFPKIRGEGQIVVLP